MAFLRDRFAEEGGATYFEVPAGLLRIVQIGAFGMTQYIVSSGATSHVTVGSGSVMSVFDTGIVKDITVTSGGVISAYDGGVTSGVQISRNPISPGEQAVEYVYSSGASHKTVLHGSTEVVSGGKAYGTKLDGSRFGHSDLNVYNGGMTVSATVGQECGLTVTDGTASATILLKDGLLFVSSGGVARNTIAHEGGGDVVYSGGKASGTQLFGGVETVISGGSAYGTKVEGSGYQFLGGGNAFSTVVSSGSHQVVDAGTAIDTTIKTGGIEYVYGGTESGTKIDGGTLVLGGGKAEQPIKFSGSSGELIISSTHMPTDTISGFTSNDKIQLAYVTYASSDSVSVNTPGIVTVSAGGAEYHLKIAGAKVGETDFVFGSGSVLTKNVAVKMAFLQPPVSASAGIGGLGSEAGTSAAMTASDFAPRILGGVENFKSTAQFGVLDMEKVLRAAMGTPVSISQAF